MKVKICGITDMETAKFVQSVGGDAIGLVFAPSKRQITIEQGEEISRALSKDILKIGVFVNEEIQRVQEIYHRCQLDYVQLHGDETIDYVKALHLPAIKAFSLEKKEDVHLMKEFQSDYVLADSPRELFYGGNGKVFNWNILKEMNRPFILAGGLTEENVEEAISKSRPFMVDVSSGVETNGVKDKTKIKAFITKVKGVKQDVGN